MYGNLVMGRSRLTIEVVAGEPDDEHGGAAELKGYWLVVTETDDGGDDGLEVRVAVEPHVAELLVSSWREHLASAGRELVADDELRELMDRDGDGAVRVVTPISAAGNRRARRSARFGDGLAAQDAAASRAARKPGGAA